MLGTWAEGFLGGGPGGSKGEEYEEIILESMACAGRMRKRILQNGLVSGMEILKILGQSSGTGALSSGTERTGAKIWNQGSKDRGCLKSAGL